jgi:ribonucleoside-diphosphate reductase beta chain
MYIEKHPHALFPLLDKTAYGFYETLVSTFWSHEALDYSKDRAGFLALPEALQHTLLSILSFFAVSDVIVGEHVLNTLIETAGRESQLALAMQSANEAVHAVTYNKLIEAIVVDESQRYSLYNGMLNGKALANKFNPHPDGSLLGRLLSFLFVEGVMFSSSFAYIFWLQDYLGTRLEKSNVNLPATFGANEYIARDEALHTHITAHIILTKFPNLDLSKSCLSKVKEQLKFAVEAECKFVDEVIPDFNSTMNKQLVKDHVMSCADAQLALLGLPPVYNKTSTFTNLIGASVPTNNSFFERRSTVYTKLENNGLILVEKF